MTDRATHASPTTGGRPLETLIEDLIEAYSNTNFIHHNWYIQYHLEIVEKISLELLEKYSDADRELVLALVWIHDYGKTIDQNNQYQLTLTEGRKRLAEAGFDDSFSDRVVSYVEILDKKVDLASAPIEVQIVSSADGCSHFVGPFFQLWWLENSHKPFKELMADNRAKAVKDWTKKIVLPEARSAFQGRFHFVLEQCGDIPHQFTVE